MGFPDSGARPRWALAIAGLLLGAGCAGPAVVGSPGDGNPAALVDAWLIPETPEGSDHTPTAGGFRPGARGGGRVGPHQDISPSGDDDFIVLEGVPEPPEETPVAVRVSAVEARVLDGEVDMGARRPHVPIPIVEIRKESQSRRKNR